MGDHGGGDLPETTPLHDAVLRGDIKTVNGLLHGVGGHVDVNARMKHWVGNENDGVADVLYAGGATALHIASQTGNAEVCV